jgi:ABC-type dipeptide/oligopeptide/nickel transport system permease subunit
MLIVAPEILMFIVLFAALGLCVAGVYILPALIACLRGHRNAAAIVVMNILLGWTFVGWAFALVWALTDNVRSRDYIRYSR